MIKKFLATIKELRKTPRGKALLFFGGYFLFFILIMIVFRISPKMSIKNYNYDKGAKDDYSLSKIEANNYNYKYGITVDDTNYIITGKRNKEKEEFSFMDNNYFHNNDNYFTLNNGIWIKCANPNNYNYFTDITNLKELLNKSFFLSKTDYESGKVIYNYLITTNQIIKSIHNLDIDIADLANEIILSTDEEGNTNQIRLKLDSYCQYEKICNKSLEIILNYDEFGNVSEIESPI